MPAGNKYEPTAARRHGRPGRELRPKSVTIDIHSHVAIPKAAAFVAPHYDPSKDGLALYASPETKAVNDKQGIDMRTRLVARDSRLAALAAMGVDRQVIKPPPAQCYYTLPLDIAVQAARLVNDGIGEFV